MLGALWLCVAGSFWFVYVCLGELKCGFGCDS